MRHGRTSTPRSRAKRQAPLKIFAKACFPGGSRWSAAPGNLEAQGSRFGSGLSLVTSATTSSVGYLKHAPGSTSSLRQGVFMLDSLAAKYARNQLKIQVARNGPGSGHQLCIERIVRLASSQLRGLNGRRWRR